MRKFAWLLLFTGVVGVSLSLHAQQAGADLILFNGKIITVNDTFQIAQAVAVRGSRIVAVGSNADVNKLAGPNTQRIDLRGKSMVPGFIDNHAHFQEEGAYWTMELRFDGMDTRKKVLDAISAKAKATPNGGWVYNLGGWSPAQFSDDKREFTRHSEPIAMEPQVFDLLLYLLQNRDRVVSRDDLIASVWNGRIVSESTLSTRITAARKAIGDTGEDQILIKTYPRSEAATAGRERLASLK